MKTQSQKWERIQSIMPDGPGHKKVTVIKNGKILTGTLTIMPLFDQWKWQERGWKQAGNQIYDIIIRQNGTN